MKGVYYSEGLSFKGSDNIGIEQKVSQQIKCLESIGELSVINSDFSKGVKERIKFLLPFIKSDREKKREKILKIVDEDTDYIYIRKPSLTIKFYKLLKKIKRQYPGIYIIMEIPTYPFHSEYTGFSKLMVLKSLHCERKLKKVVDRIATYSDDDEIWGIPTIKMANCVVYKNIRPRGKRYEVKNGTIRLTCIANFTYWHGLDRLINGMREYKGDYNVVLNVVGGGKELDKLKKLAKGMDNVFFHGPKTGEELTKIFDETDIAVDALGRHRSGVYYNSSLKGKEYSARGIPIISAVKTELDNMKDFPYYLKLPADDSYIDIKDIIKFYEKIYLENRPDEITKYIRTRTRRYFDYEHGFKEKIEEAVLDRLFKGGEQKI